MDESHKFIGVKSYLRRKKSVDELQDMADEIFASATEEVVITSIGTEGTSSSGQVSFPKWGLLKCVEELILEANGGRQIMSFPNYCGLPSQT